MVLCYLINARAYASSAELDLHQNHTSSDNPHPSVTAASLKNKLMTNVYQCIHVLGRGAIPDISLLLIATAPREVKSKLLGLNSDMAELLVIGIVITFSMRLAGPLVTDKKLLALQI